MKKSSIKWRIYMQEKKKTMYAENINPCSGEKNFVTIAASMFLDETNVKTYKNGLARVELGHNIDSGYSETKFYIQGSIMNFLRVENVTDIKENIGEKDACLVFGDRRFSSGIYIKSSNIGKRLSYQFQTLESVLTISEYNTLVKNTDENTCISQETKENISLLEKRISLLDDRLSELSNLESYISMQNDVLKELRREMEAMKEHISELKKE